MMKNNLNDDSIFTAAIHAGFDLNQHFGAVSTPIYPSTIFAFNDAETGAAIHNNERAGFYYSRLGNPTQNALEHVMCQLEAGEAALAFASGMAAISATLLTLLKAGDHAVAPESLYATTNKFFDFLAENFNVVTTYVDATNAENYRAATRENTRIFYLETPANPTLKITDIDAVTKIAREQNIKTIADNTFATPFNQQPLALGVDAVVHSATKYLGGHSDLTAGVLVGTKEIIETTRLKTTALFGGNIAPQIAWLVLRGIKTLPLRMERHNQNAFVIANMLSSNSKVKAVYYPGLETHFQHSIAKQQMRGFGGMIAFDVGDQEAGKRLINNVRLCTLATSLGGVETIIQHPASMTNAGTPRESRLKTGITDGLIRLSVGIERIEDIIGDLENALREI